MKNQYAGDIGDFGKFLLLNFLAYKDDSMHELDYNLGVNWYLTEDDNTSHGKHIDYLKNDKDNLENCLPPYSNYVYGKLKSLIESERSISNIIKLNVLPEKTIFYNDILYPNNRSEWLKNSIDILAESNLIFFDPDNGIIASNDKKNAKSMLAFELEYYYNNLKANFVIYFHHNRFDGDVINNIKKTIYPILKDIDPKIRFRILVYRKTSTRFFIVINKLNDINLYLKLDLFMQKIDNNIFYEIPLTPMKYNTNRIIETENEIIIEDFPACKNSELILARRIARPEDFPNIVPAIDDPRELKIDLKFSPIEYMRMCYGFIPQSMEDKWIIYNKDNKLYFHRNLTRNCIYILEITESNDEYIVNKAWASKKEGPQEDSAAIENIKNIIKYNLLGEY